MKRQELLTAMRNGTPVRFISRDISGVRCRGPAAAVRDLWVGRKRSFGEDKSETWFALTELVKAGLVRREEDNDGKVIRYVPTEAGG
jgi:hypothetical protein